MHYRIATLIQSFLQKLPKLLSFDTFWHLLLQKQKRSKPASFDTFWLRAAKVGSKQRQNEQFLFHFRVHCTGCSSDWVI